jgi:hypothetical protein
MPHPLDRWMPDFQFTETHARTTHASAAACLDVAARLDPADDPLVRAALALREAPGRLLEALGRPGALQRRPRFGLRDFLLLERDADRSLCFGLAGAFWQADYGLRPLATPQAFSALREPGIVRLTLSFHVEPLAMGIRLITTTRVECPDADSLRRFRLYWWLIRPVSGLIRRRLLSHVCRGAETGFAAVRNR